MDESNIAVDLTWAEALLAAQVAILRQVSNRFRALKDKHGLDADGGWNEHIEGCGGEMAVAKHFGLYYTGALGNFHAPDVGALQVRTASRPDARLILHPADKDEDVFILVTGRLPCYVLRGWLLGAEGKLPAYWTEPVAGRAAYFVPQSVLHPLCDIPRSP